MFPFFIVHNVPALLRQSHPAQQVGVARVGADAVKARFSFYSVKFVVAIVIRV
jgi:hypothetical protein